DHECACDWCRCCWLHVLPHEASRQRCSVHDGVCRRGIASDHNELPSSTQDFHEEQERISAIVGECCCAVVAVFCSGSTHFECSACCFQNDDQEFGTPDGDEETSVLL